MADLNTDVRYIKGIGEQRAKALGKLGIATLRDLISYFPRAYDDRTQLRRIADLVPGEAAGVVSARNIDAFGSGIGEGAFASADDGAHVVFAGHAGVLHGDTRNDALACAEQPDTVSLGQVDDEVLDDVAVAVEETDEGSRG